jgi:hypothetical protein
MHFKKLANIDWKDMEDKVEKNCVLERWFKFDWWETYFDRDGTK